MQPSAGCAVRGALSAGVMSRSGGGGCGGGAGRVTALLPASAVGGVAGRLRRRQRRRAAAGAGGVACRQRRRRRRPGCRLLPWRKRRRRRADAVGVVVAFSAERGVRRGSGAVRGAAQAEVGAFREVENHACFEAPVHHLVAVPPSTF